MIDHLDRNRTTGRSIRKEPADIETAAACGEHSGFIRRAVAIPVHLVAPAIATAVDLVTENDRAGQRCPLIEHGIGARVHRDAIDRTSHIAIDDGHGTGRTVRSVGDFGCRGDGEGEGLARLGQAVANDRHKCGREGLPGQEGHRAGGLDIVGAGHRAAACGAETEGQFRVDRARKHDRHRDLARHAIGAFDDPGILDEEAELVTAAIVVEDEAGRLKQVEPAREHTSIHIGQFQNDTFVRLDFGVGIHPDIDDLRDFAGNEGHAARAAREIRVDIGFASARQQPVVHRHIRCGRRRKPDFETQVIGVAACAAFERRRATHRYSGQSRVVIQYCGLAQRGLDNGIGRAQRKGEQFARLDVRVAKHRHQYGRRQLPRGKTDGAAARDIVLAGHRRAIHRGIAYREGFGRRPGKAELEIREFRSRIALDQHRL